MKIWMFVLAVLALAGAAHGASCGLDWPQKVVVDHRGSGDYLTIKEAVDYVASISFGAGSRDWDTQWVIYVLPGKYVEKAFTIPGYASVVCLPTIHPSFGGLDTKQVQIFNDPTVTQGTFINAQGGELAGCGVVLEGVPTGRLVAVGTDAFWLNISESTLEQMADASTHEVVLIEATNQSIVRLEGVNVLHEGRKQAKAVGLRTDGGYATVHHSYFSDVHHSPRYGAWHSGPGFMTFRGTSFGQTEGSSYGSDLRNDGPGVLRVEHSSYRTSTGTIDE